VTNCATGKAEYLHENRDNYRLSTLGKASASVPLFSKWWSWMEKNIWMAGYQTLFLLNVQLNRVIQKT